MPAADDEAGQMVIAEIAYESLAPGVLGAHFAAGKAAVLVHCPEIVAELWRGLLEDDAEQLPWQAPLIDIARNYHGSADITVSLGDLFYFQPGQHGYIARKIALTKVEGDEAFVAEPSNFVQGDGRFATPDKILGLCWSIGERLMAAMAPEGAAPGGYRVAVQRLKYQQTTDDFDRLGALSRNSLGRWGRAGFSLDEWRTQAAGPLQRKWVSDLYGLIAQVPFVRRLAKSANRLFSRRDQRTHLMPGQRLIEAPHFDHRYFTALCGQRRDVVTQIFVDGVWHDLPIGMDSLAIFSGSIATRKFGVPHLLHRVVHVSGDPGTPDDAPAWPRTQNVTLLIGTT